MKQVININYHGRIIPIEVAAYEILKNYTADLLKHFKDEEGKDEIINDIESRISELFHEQLSKGLACITENDVNEIIKSMGKPEQLESENEVKHNPIDNNKQINDSATIKRLYRDENNKLFGGVCSGLGNYFNIDSVWIRIMFVVLLVSFGVGLIPYIIFWIAVPSSASATLGSTRKKLYRDIDAKIIGGVCSGLSHYFGINVWIPRILFLIPIISMILESNDIAIRIWPGSFLVYIIFWLVMPVAKSTSEKLEMKGEKVDMNSIKNAINDEMKGVKERTEKIGNVAGERFKEMKTDSFGALKRLINLFTEVVVVFVKFFSYSILTIIGLALVLFLLGITFTSFVAVPFKDYLLNGFWQNSFAFGFLLFFIMLSTIIIIVGLIKKIAGIKTKNKWVTRTFVALWIVGWISLFGLVSTLGSDFSNVSHRNTNEREITIQQPTNEKLIVKLNNHPYFNNKEGNSINLFEALDLFKDSIFIENVKIKVIRSLDDSFHMRLVHSAHGRTRKTADTTAATIRLGITQSDSVLMIDQGTFITKKEKFRNQQVVVLISVPTGKIISLPKSNSISNFDDDIWEFQNWKNEDNQNQEFQMTNEGLQSTKEIYRLDKFDNSDSLIQMKKTSAN